MIDRTRCATILLVILGIGFVIAGVLLFVFGDAVIDDAVKKGCELRPGTPAYEEWRNPPVPLYISFYVFDLNDTEFLNGTKTPFLRQRGPFVYKEVRTKNNVQEYENGTISYHEDRNYTFDRSKSCETCDDETTNITTINIVYMALMNYLQTEDIPSIFRDIVAQLLSFQESPIMRRTVKEYLWGYQDAFLEKLKEEFPTIVTSDQVSVFYASVSGAGANTFLINNGVDVHKNNTTRIKQVGNIERFNFKTSVSYWSNEYANRINGTDSTIWHPDTKTTDQIYTFISDICRSLPLEWSESRTNQFGIANQRFLLQKNVFENSPENEGFCLNFTTRNNTRELQCLPSGLMSLKTCIKLSGTSVSMPLPIIASSPHFLDADPSVQNAVQGLTPDELIHRSFMDVEPITGTVMNGSRRLQINLNVVNDSTIPPISHLTPFVYPMIWLDEHAEIDEPRAKEFRSKVAMPMTILKVLKYLLLAIGAVLFVIVIVLIVHSYHKTKTSGPAFPTLVADEASPLLV